MIGELLSQRWSPQQISRHLRQRFPDDPAMWLCHESIYQAVYQPGSPLMRPSPLAPQHRSPLRTGRDHRRAQQRTDRRRPRFEQPMLSIHQRPFPPEDRAEAGHWEGDLIIGKDQQSAIGTLVERQTRLVRLLHLPQRDGDTLHDALRARLGDLPPALRRSITWDQGTEMARHLTITETLGAPVYFCDSRSPWQRGSNENTNGLLRDYFPKGTDLRVHSAEHLLAVENELNNRPRRVLDDRSPADLFDALLASPESVRVATLTGNHPADRGSVFTSPLTTVDIRRRYRRPAFDVACLRSGSMFVESLLAAPVGVGLLAALEGTARGDVWATEMPRGTDRAAVKAAAASVAGMSWGELLALAVETGLFRVGPWMSEAPANLADAYRHAGERRPIAEAIADRFGTALHGPLDPSVQQWWHSGSPEHEWFVRPRFRRFDDVYGAGQFTFGRDVDGVGSAAGGASRSDLVVGARA